MNLKANSFQMNIKAYWDYFISRYNEAIHGLFDKKGTNATKSLKRENKNRWEENVDCETHRTKRNVPAWKIIYIYIVLQYM